MDGQCSACHFTSAWKPASFNHAGLNDCQSCHSGNRPANHYDGQCSLCHSTSAWKPATFNHSAIGGADCSQCHQPPANHFPGECKGCHTDTGNWRNASFNHSFPLNHGEANGNCGACHTSGVPGPAPCSVCHDQGKMDEKHREVRNYDGNCLACHPNGTH